MIGRTPIFSINLARRLDRRAFIEGQLAKLGLTATRMEAVTVPEVPQELIDMHGLSSHPYRCSPGDLACGLSHVSVWQHVLRSGYENAIILEDDVLLDASFLPFTEPDVLSRLGAEILKLETWRKRVKVGSHRASLGSTQIHELLSTHLGSAAYLISRAGIKRAVASPMLNRMTVDRVLFGKGGAHLLRGALQAVPSPAIQLDRFDASTTVSRSDIYDNRKRAMEEGRVDPTQALGMEIAHVFRIVAILLRDPSVLRAKRDRIAFAGDK